MRTQLHGFMSCLSAGWCWAVVTALWITPHRSPLDMHLDPVQLWLGVLGLHLGLQRQGALMATRKEQEISTPAEAREAARRSRRTRMLSAAFKDGTQQSPCPRDQATHWLWELRFYPVKIGVRRVSRSPGRQGRSLGGRSRPHSRLAALARGGSWHCP